MTTRRTFALLIPVLLLGSCGEKPRPAAAEPCVTRIETGPLPQWARGGFSDDGSGTPHVSSKKGDMVGVLFGSPLSAPPADDHSNKILWVSKPPVTMPSDFTIVASLAGTGETYRPKVDSAPGPSTVDLPRAGCWRLTLSWSGHVDTMDLTYSS